MPMASTTNPFDPSLFQDWVNATADAVREPAFLRVTFFNNAEKEILTHEYVYDKQFADHYLKTAIKVSRQDTVWAHSVEFTLLNRDKQPIVSSLYRRFDIPSKWMF